jgi:CRP/FNR family cyclic AMP-dependent transcriptional regulator
MDFLDGQAQERFQSSGSEGRYIAENAGTGSEGDLRHPPMHPNSGTNWNDIGARWRTGEFCRCLPPKGMLEFESLATPFCCKEDTVLLTEGEKTARVLFLLDGQVKLSMNSMEGRRLIIGVAAPGDFLGLAAVVSGLPCEVTAEARLPCKIKAIPRQSFIDFLFRYPVAWQNVGCQMSFYYKRACDQLRLLGFQLTAPTRLALLLLEWCDEDQRKKRCARIHCSLTHGEIGQYIGVGRETVTRILADFRNRELVEQRGATLIISSLRALEIYAGQL